jgi:1-aminocyclopropane-1-carboxylate deaminase/D-cysteine desulfhydrase-like pyridoxal-dependent ACC family enzyme
MGKGYGHPTPEGERARALAAEYGVRLDPTYGAKAFSYFLKTGNGTQRAIFWHTFAWPW